MKMTRDEIDDVVCEILHHDGPDRHIVGHEKITDFIIAIINNYADDWIDEYVNSKDYIKYVDR